jgi:hypothetical protein
MKEYWLEFNIYHEDKDRNAQAVDLIKTLVYGIGTKNNLVNWHYFFEPYLRLRLEFQNPEDKSNAKIDIEEYLKIVEIDYLYGKGFNCVNESDYDGNEYVGEGDHNALWFGHKSWLTHNSFATHLILATDGYKDYAKISYLLHLLVNPMGGGGYSEVVTYLLSFLVGYEAREIARAVDDSTAPFDVAVREIYKFVNEKLVDSGLVTLNKEKN